MASVCLTEDTLGALKKALRDFCPGTGQSHLCEALATAAGFKTYAALRATMAQEAQDPPFYLLDNEHFDQRLHEFGYPPDPEFSFEAAAQGIVIETIPSSGYEIEYRSARAKAWRNLMVIAINEGLRRKLFSLRANDNRWPGAVSADSHDRGKGYIYDFSLPDGTPAAAYVGDAGFGELSIHAAAKPTGRFLSAGNADFSAGEAVARGWLERERGAWLQSSEEFLSCRRSLVPLLAAMKVRPLGFGDRGRVIV